MTVRGRAELSGSPMLLTAIFARIDEWRDPLGEGAIDYARHIIYGLALTSAYAYE
jgi:hypothetical protein